MNTQTHLLLAAAILGKNGRGETRPTAFQGAILAGAFLPDLSIFALALFGTISGLSAADIWEVAYWSPPWQTAGAVSNSVPLWALLLGTGALWKNDGIRLFAMAGLLHLAFDFPLHAEDAHRHFWPLTDWRFVSAVSYWDPARYGMIASTLEAVLGLGLCVVLWRRHARRAVRALLALAAAAYVLVPIFWIVSFAPGQPS